MERWVIRSSLERLWRCFAVSIAVSHNAFRFQHPLIAHLMVAGKTSPTKKARLCRRVEWQRPSFPEGSPSSIIGAERLHCRVRDGNGCFPPPPVFGNYSLFRAFPTLFPAASDLA